MRESADRATTRPLAGTVFYVLLALADGERYGLDMAKEIERRTEGEVVLGPGTLYNAVARMLEAGLIEEVADPDGSAGDPRRRYYRITDAGRQTVAQEAARLERLVEAARAKQVLPADGTA